MDRDTDLPIVFDAACFYAHNECKCVPVPFTIENNSPYQIDDLGVWRADWNEIGTPYIAQYHKHFPISAPEEDHDNLNALYAT